MWLGIQNISRKIQHIHNLCKNFILGQTFIITRYQLYPQGDNTTFHWLQNCKSLTPSSAIFKIQNGFQTFRYITLFSVYYCNIVAMQQEMCQFTRNRCGNASKRLPWSHFYFHRYLYSILQLDHYRYTRKLLDNKNMP